MVGQIDEHRAEMRRNALKIVGICPSGDPVADWIANLPCDPYQDFLSWLSDRHPDFFVACVQGRYSVISWAAGAKIALTANQPTLLDALSAAINASTWEPGNGE